MCIINTIFRLLMLVIGFSVVIDSVLFCCQTDNGFNPIWNEACLFDIGNPDVALIHFSVLDEDTFGDPNLLGQATYPVNSLCPGKCWGILSNYSL